MDNWEPGRVWRTVRERVQAWWDDGDAQDSQSNEDEADATMLMHMSVTAPIVIGLLILMRRTVS